MPLAPYRIFPLRGAGYIATTGAAQTAIVKLEFLAWDVGILSPRKTISQEQPPSWEIARPEKNTVIAADKQRTPAVNVLERLICRVSALSLVKIEPRIRGVNPDGRCNPALGSRRARPRASPRQPWPVRRCRRRS